MMSNCTISDSIATIIDTSFAIELAQSIGMQDVYDNLSEGLLNTISALALMPEELFTEDELEFLAVATKEQN